MVSSRDQNPHIGFPDDTETVRESVAGVLDPSLTVTDSVNDAPLFVYCTCEEFDPTGWPLTFH
jgi:hypothetical protein